MTMKRMFRFLFTACLAVVLIGLTTNCAEGQILISELMPDPARDWDGDGAYNYRDDEWIEIVNAGDQSVDLNGYIIRDGGDNGTWRYGFSGIINPGQTFIVYGSDSRAWEESNGFPVYGLSLNNSGDEIFLCTVADGETLTVDTVSFGRSASDDRSVGRSSDDISIWVMFDAWNPCPESCDPAGNGCLPTPGRYNTCVTATGPRSWGDIKLFGFK
jgi:hypothetical protein